MMSRGEDLQQLGAVAPHLERLIKEEASQRLQQTAARFAELAHATSRTSYWMVRDGTPSRDRPLLSDYEREIQETRYTWEGDPGHIAKAITFWTTASVHAAWQTDTPRAARAALFALDRAYDVAHRCSVWWTPTPRWVEAMLCAELSQRVPPRRRALVGER